MLADPADGNLRKGVLTPIYNSGRELKQGVLTPIGPADGDLGEVQENSQPKMDPARAAYAHLLDRAESHLCRDKAGIFCALANSLKDTYLGSPAADFLEVLGNMHGHYCADQKAAATEQCKLLHLLAKSVPPVKIHTFSQIDKQPLIQIDANVKILHLNDKTDGATAAATVTEEEQKYMQTVSQVSAHMCDKQAGSLLCHLSLGFVKHYKQAIAAGDNKQYLDFIRSTKDFYCQGEGGESGHTECKLFPLLLSGIPPPHNLNSGTEKILSYLKVLDNSVNWYCENDHTSFCYLAPGLKQAFLTSLKDHESATYMDYMTRIQKQYCTDQKDNDKPCKVYDLLKRGVPDLVHHDLDVDGLKALPPLSRFIPHSQQPADGGTRLGSDQSPHEAAAAEQTAKEKALNKRIAKAQNIGMKLATQKHELPKSKSQKEPQKAEPRKVEPKSEEPKQQEAPKQDEPEESPKTGTEYPNVILPSRDKSVPEQVNVDKTLHEMELEECAKERATSVFCQLSRALNQVFDKEKASPKFYKLLADITNHYCVERKAQHQARCEAMESMLAGHEQAAKPTKAKHTAAPASGHMSVAHDGQVKHTPA